MHELGQLHADHGTTNLPCYLFAWTKDVKRGKNQIKWIWISFKFQLLPSNVYFHLPYLRKRHCYWFLFLSISLYQDGNFDQCLTQINKRQNWWRDAAKVIIFCCWKNRKEKNNRYIWWKKATIHDECIINCIKYSLHTKRHSTVKTESWEESPTIDVQIRSKLKLQCWYATRKKKP